MIDESIVSRWAKRYRLDHFLVLAVISVESSGDAWANRYEPNWRWWLNVKWWARKLRISDPTEKINQAISWGPMQVMGTVARELGFTQNLTMLCDPTIGIDYGCRKLRQCLDRSNGEVISALSRYNTGRPSTKQGRAYADKVLAMHQKLKGM